MLLYWRERGQGCPHLLMCKWVRPTFFVGFCGQASPGKLCTTIANRDIKKVVAHPLIAPVLELATPIATDLGLEIFDISFLTHANPPVLRVDLRNPTGEVGLEDCERMSRALEIQLDASDAIPDAYVLEISSPGIAEELTSDRDFVSFKSFPVIAETEPPHKGKREWRGRLIGRDVDAVYLNQKGRSIALPRTSVIRVCFDDRAE